MAHEKGLMIDMLCFAGLSPGSNFRVDHPQQTSMAAVLKLGCEA